MGNTPLQILQENWNFTNFRPQQEEIIDAVLGGNDTFALLPTGGGKSLCFQVPALLKEGICVVISPLIALIQDQVENLQKKGIKAIALTSGIKYKDLDTLLDNCIYGNYKFLYLSPERLQQDIVQERIKKMKVNLIAVDEAHCISQWGNDFRPSYKKISILRNITPTTPIIALTASATLKVQEDIIKELDLFDPSIFKQSFYRKNLAFRIYETQDKYFALEQILKKYKGSTIIYVRNRKAAKEISDFLNQSYIKTTYYHGGIDRKVKEDRYKKWLIDEIRVMVATNAFGMGIDKSEVRLVIHFAIPESIESYFQEVGRAGRDNKPAQGIMIKNKSDIITVKNQFIKVLPDFDFVKLVYRKLSNYFSISYGEGQQTTHYFNFSEFCRTYSLNPLMTYNTLQFLDRCSICNFIPRSSKKSEIHILVSSDKLLLRINKSEVTSYIIKAILRTYIGIFDEPVEIDLSLIAQKINKSESEIVQVLNTLKEEDLITFDYRKSDAEIVFLVPREDEHTINRIKPYLEELVNSKKEKVKAMISFVQNSYQCRYQQLLNYFGEKFSKNCGVCDVCIKNSDIKVDVVIVKKAILDLLRDGNYSSRELMSTLSYDEDVFLRALRELNEIGKIKISINNKYQLI